MIRILLVMLGLLSAWHTVAAAAPWNLPAGVKTVEVNGYPMAFLESGTGESVVLVHGGGTDYRTWRRQVESPPRGFRLIAVSLRHYYPERWDGKGDTFSVNSTLKIWPPSYKHWGLARSFWLVIRAAGLW